MRPLPFIILILALTSQLGCAEAVWSSYVKTNRCDFTVTEEEIAKTPIWNEPR